MASRHVNRSFRRDDAFALRLKPRERRATCKVCGAPRDVFHDDAKCVNRWLEQQDAEARKRAGTP